MPAVEYRFRWRGWDVVIGPWLPDGNQEDLPTRYLPEPEPAERFLWTDWNRTMVEIEIAELSGRRGLSPEESRRLDVLSQLKSRLDDLRDAGEPQPGPLEPDESRTERRARA